MKTTVEVKVDSTTLDLMKALEDKELPSLEANLDEKMLNETLPEVSRLVYRLLRGVWDLADTEFRADGTLANTCSSSARMLSYTTAENCIRHMNLRDLDDIKSFVEYEIQHRR